MARRRMLDVNGLFLDVELWKAIGKDGILLYERLWGLAEDWGGLELHPQKIALQLGMFKCSAKRVKQFLDKLIKIKSGHIIPYEHEGKTYGWLKNFCKYQKLTNPSPPTLPLPPWIDCEIKEYKSGKKYARYTVIKENLPSAGTLPVAYQKATTKLPEDYQDTTRKETENTEKETETTSNLRSRNRREINNYMGTNVPICRQSSDDNTEVLPPNPITTSTTNPGDNKSASPNNHTEGTSFAEEEVASNDPPFSVQGNTSTESTSAATDTCPKDCPHQAIINLYHEMLPELPRVKVWNKQRRRLLRARWREDPERQNLDWWREFFNIVRNSPFLLGQVVMKNGQIFQADLEWLIRPDNFAKVLEGRYLKKSWEGKLSPRMIRNMQAVQEFLRIQEEKKGEVSPTLTSVTIHNIKAAREFLERRRKMKEKMQGES